MNQEGYCSAGIHSVYRDSGSDRFSRKYSVLPPGTYR